MSGGGELGCGWVFGESSISIPAPTPSARQAPHRTSLRVWIIFYMHIYDCGYQPRGTAQEKGQPALACRIIRSATAALLSPAHVVQGMSPCDHQPPTEPSSA